MKRSVYGGLAVIAIAVILAASCVARPLAPPAALVTGPGGQVTDSVPDADDFTATPTTGAAPLLVRFGASSSAAVSTWTWNFGDGGTATTQNPTHTYQSAGVYSVSLVAMSSHGATTVRKAGYITVSTAASPASTWTTVVDDEFNVAGLPSHWAVYRGSFGDGAHNCASASLAQVPGDGYLHLKMAYFAKGPCGAGWYTSGMEVSAAYGGVNQAVTVRWRVVPSKDPGVVRAQRVIPMRWVDDPRYAWYQGEADYCEGAHLNGCYTFLHYGPNSAQIMHYYAIDLTQWHTWRIEAYNHKVSVFIDNLAKPAWVFNGNETTTPAAVMRAVLQLECPLAGCPPASYTGEVEDVEVDWIIIQNLAP